MSILTVCPHSNGCHTEMILLILHCILHDLLFLRFFISFLFITVRSLVKPTLDSDLLYLNMHGRFCCIFGIPVELL